MKFMNLHEIVYAPTKGMIYNATPMVARMRTVGLWIAIVWFIFDIVNLGLPAFLCLWAYEYSYGNSTNWYIWWSNNGRSTTYFHSFRFLPKPPCVGDFPAGLPEGIPAVRATFTATGATGPATPGPRSRSAPRSRGDATCQVSRLFLSDFQNGIFKTAEKLGMPSSNTIETWGNYSKLDLQTAGLRNSLFLSLAILGRLFWPIPVYSPLIKHGNGNVIYVLTISGLDCQRARNQ
jgi:hypothetical protein